MASGSDPNGAKTILAGIAAAVVLFVVIVVLQAYFYRANDEEQRKKAELSPTQQLAQVRAEQQEILNSYRWIDQKAGVVAIPIDRAIELEIRDAAARREHPAS